MYRRTRDDIICDDNDLVYLSELMLRWPFECYLKICHELFVGKLKLHIVTQRYVSRDGCQKNIIMVFPPRNIAYDYIEKKFNIFAFKRSHIEKIEQNKIEYTFIPSADLIRNEYVFCTMKSINKLAPQVAYAICLTAHKRFYNKFEVRNVLDAIQTETPNRMIYVGNIAKKEWEFSDVQIWNVNRIPPRQSVNKNKDLNPVKYFIQRQREQGVNDAKRLAKLVDTFFPDLLTDHDLGALLPARTQRNITYESQRKRGQRLRKDI